MAATCQSPINLLALPARTPGFDGRNPAQDSNEQQNKACFTAQEAFVL
jgi:hypothetical protein